MKGGILSLITAALCLVNATVSFRKDKNKTSGIIWLIIGALELVSAALEHKMAKDAA